MNIDEMHVDEIVRRMERWLEWAEKRKGKRARGIKVIMNEKMVAGNIRLEKP